MRMSLRRFIIAAFVLWFFGFGPARADTPLIEILKANPEWFGTVDATRQLAVTFHVKGNPPKLENVSYRWESEERRDSLEFKVGERNVEFLIPPRDRNRWYKLDFTNDGALIGTLTGLQRDKELTFLEMVLLRPVERRTGPPVELKASAKHCSVPPDFAISDGKDLPPELKRFLGYFSGQWGRSDEFLVYHTLLVVDINTYGHATVYYAYEPATGLYAQYRRFHDPGCSRRQAKVEDGTLTINFPNGDIAKYRFSDADTLQATLDIRNSSYPGTFKRHD